MEKVLRAHSRIKSFAVQNKTALLFWLILLAAVLARVIYFTKLPPALNNDEAAIGYDTWSLLKYGVDRNGTHLPVHLISWGSGQNAIYAYLSMPFVALFGLNIFTVRIVNLIFGTLSVAVTYFFVKNFYSVRTALFTMGLVAVSPWHILLSRWGLESNLFPSLFLIGVWLFTSGIRKDWMYIAGAAVLALSLYAYGTAYLVVPLFLLAAVPYMIYKYRPKTKIIAFSALVFAAVALPIALFVLTNKFGWGDIKILGFTAPSLTGTSRMSTAAGGTGLKNALSNLYRMLIVQDDGLLYNCVPGFGICYYISIPFALYGGYRVMARKDLFSVATGIWLAAGIALFFVYSDVNINRVNIVFLPLIIFAGIGVCDVFKNKKQLIAAALVYCIMFTGFFAFYCTDVKRSLESRTGVHLGEAVAASQRMADGEKTIYYSDAFWVPYIYTLFYEKTPVKDYIDTVKIEDMTNEMQIVLSYTNHRFYIDELECGEAGVYIMTTEELTGFKEKYSERITEIQIINNLAVAQMN
ncbi:MAG: glycosyltransferase family 39 protein [Clostridia bacterium]|nr:glycosyltransferase family 39 protein [Clostridia bacterium]